MNKLVRFLSASCLTAMILSPAAAFEPVHAQQSTVTANDQLIRLFERNLTYQFNGKKAEKTAFLTYSQQHPYSFYLLPDYVFNSEKGKTDTIFYKENKNHWMKMEPLSPKTDWKKVEESAKKELKSYGQRVKLIKPKTSSPFLEDAVIYQTKRKHMATTVYLIKSGNVPLKLMVHTHHILHNNHSSAFLEMAKTIDEHPVFVRPVQTTLSFMENGKEYKQPASLYNSTNQPFSMYVMKDFKADPEEPGKDLVYHQKSPSVNMRIELMNTQADWKMIEKTSIQQLKSVNEKVHRHIWGQPDPMLEGAVMLHADNEREWVQIILLPHHEVPMKLTIRSTNQLHSVAHFLAMAKTIELSH
ncbi:hypothetical protein ACFOU2_13100 [Bacillus songklensis]|uniref:DUF3298 domain-containing protein n=1 Tax=Bacillus songklensis TaxID=1069116 RepID=A0ABV8B517_9BACI